MLSLLLMTASLQAAAKPVELTALEVYENVLKAQKRQAALECTIVREEIRTGAPEKVTGTLKTAAGGLAWLEITVPSRQLAVSDGKALYVELSDVKQVMKYDAQQLKKGGNFFLDLGSSISHYAKQSLKRLILPGEGFDAKKIYALELMPLDAAQAGFDRMRVWVDKDAWLVRQVELKLGGVDTRVSFQDIKVLSLEQAAKGAKAPDPKLFKYKAPKGYEVFDLASMQ
jgi:outer membrane lipoprotein-sorting protein